MALRAGTFETLGVGGGGGALVMNVARRKAERLELGTPDADQMAFT